MPSPADRLPIHAYLSPEARDSWVDFAASQGVSLSALLEALAGDLPRHDGDLRSLGIHETDWAEVVRFARLVDARRRRRGKVTS